jgi:transcriptional regulator with XRE-family HTH domain
MGQKRDNLFGTELALRRGAGRFTYRELEELTQVSRSKLHRWEKGQGLPLELAEVLALDNALSAGGTLTALFTPSSYEPAAISHRVSYLAKYEGNVWLWIAPTQPTNLLISWGPWEHSQVVDSPKFLVTGKNAGTQNSVMLVEFQIPTAIRFGVGPPPGTPVQEIHGDWEMRQPGITSEALLSLLKSLLESGGTRRSLADFAQFLEVPEAALVHRLHNFIRANKD